MAFSSFLQKRATSFWDNLFFYLIVSAFGGGGVMSFFATRSAFLTGLPFYKAIIWGLVPLLLALLIVNVVHFIFLRQRRQGTRANGKCSEAWLHDLALAHRQNISRFVHVEE